MSSRLDRIIREVLEGGESTLLEADMSRRLDMLVRQGLMPASQLQILKRGLEKFNQGKVPAPNERNAVNTLLNGMMFIVLGDDTVFNRARTSIQKKKYQTEELDDNESVEEDKDWPRPFTKAERSEFIRPKEKSEDETKAIKDRMKAKNKSRPKGVQEGHLEDDSDEEHDHQKHAIDQNPKGHKHNMSNASHVVHLEKHLKSKGIHVSGDVDNEAGGTNPKHDYISLTHSKAKNATHHVTIAKGEAHVVHADSGDVKGSTKYEGVHHADNLHKLMKKHEGHLKEEKIISESYKTGHKSYTDAVNHALAHHKKGGLESSADDRAQHIGLDSKKPGKDKTTRVNLPAKDKNGKKHMVHMQVYNKGGSHPYELNTYSSTTKELQKEGAMSKDKESHDTGGFRISNKDAAAAKERAKAKSSEKRDKLSNIIKKNTIQKGKFKGYMTDEVNQGEEKMDIDWTKNPFAQAKAMKEGAFKKQATADAEEERLKSQKKAKRLSDKKGKEEQETDPGLKEGVAKNTLDIHQYFHDKKKKDGLKSKAVSKKKDKLVSLKVREESELPELDDMDLEMQENYQSPTKNNYTSKELKQAKGIAFDKRYKGGNMTGAAKAMEKIKKGLSDHPVASKALRQANEEYAKETYLSQFDGVESLNDLAEMSYKEKFEAMLAKTGKKLSDMSDEDKKKFFSKVDDTHDAVNEASAFKDAARDYAKDDKKGLAPLKKDAPKVSDAKNAKEIEHIVPQMRKAISVGKKVQFKDGKHHTVSKAHAAKFLNKYMSGKPADKEKMQSHAHASHKNFMDHAK